MCVCACRIGGFVDENEGLDAAARRELEEETGVTNERAMVQTGAYGETTPKRYFYLTVGQKTYLLTRTIVSVT